MMQAGSRGNRAYKSASPTTEGATVVIALTDCPRRSFPIWTELGSNSGQFTARRVPTALLNSIGWICE